MMIFDAHADILTDIYEETKLENKDSFRKKHLSKYKQSGITHSIFVNWTDPYVKTRTDFLACFDVALKHLKDNPDLFLICRDYDDILNAVSNHKMGVILGIEGVKYLEEPNDIIKLYDRGIRHVSLTWNEANDYGAGVSNHLQGLTYKGRELITLMDKLGMIIDLSHANEQTFKNVVQMAKGPVVVTHGNAKAICNHRRNYTDEQLKLIKEKNGVIGVCAVSNFISVNQSEQTVEFLAKHIDYMVHLIGIDHVGIGLDICYYLEAGKTSTNVLGLETIDKVGNLFTALKDMGYKENDIQKIAHGNFDRVLKQVLKKTEMIK